MTPTLTSYTISTTDTGYTSAQTINPSELNVWRIISINSDGTADAVSEYVSSTDVYFNGKEGYQNLVGTLNKIAAAYTNPSYVIRTRHMGYGTSTQYITTTTKLDQTTAPWTASTSSSTTLSNEKLGAGDVLNWDECELVIAATGRAGAYHIGDTTSMTIHWLASRRYVYNSSSGWIFAARNLMTGNIENYSGLYKYDSSSSKFISSSDNRAIRPIITLKAGLTTSGGDGKSEATAWTFS